MERPWQFATNQFLNRTKNSYLLTLILSKAHDSFLLQKTIDFPADPDWATLYARYHPLHVDFSTKYNAWVNAGGSLKGKTKSLKDFFKSMVGRLDLWIGMIIVFHPKGSPRFIELFPRDRKPFTKGKIDDKINAIDTLSTAIGSEANLSATKALVDAAYTEGDGIRTTQEGAKSSKGTGSNTVETARVAAMNMQYRNTGFLVDKYFETPALIEPCFDLASLRQGVQALFTRKMQKTENSPIVTRTFEATSVMRIKVKRNYTSTDSVTLYLGSTEGGIDSTGVNVVNDHDAKIEMSDYGITDYSTHRFVTAVTTGNAAVVELMIEFY